MNFQILFDTLTQMFDLETGDVLLCVVLTSLRSSAYMLV